MHAGTFRSTALTLEYPKRTSRYLVIAAVVATTIMAGCASRSTKAPVTDMSGAPAAPVAGGTYVVRPGDTLYKIAQANNMEVSKLTRLNNISDPSQLRVGQVLRLDGSGPMPSLPPATATTTPVTPVAPAEPVAVARASDASAINWAWPASGKIIQSFNANTKGIDIAGAAGEPVHAAADGKVMYAGNGVRGLGNLILLGHSDGFITAYAHNEALLVKTGQQIKKGAKIASIGQTDTTSPRLHFEIRRRGTPVNPLSYLPAR
ncbi:peptidoglycan DD-metalloendopeptidase family protein [Pollutimonas bauzanensis]|uniref:Lipoprotein NlpD n=1 Tax=Pollutimonas bauzanensis TaxID=658167 RepID=A0A1M5ZAE1_9BURK|nr:peptidoglycan DD-metalloendopeptidase family protein [Pollutimonas bauzanensis]SHI21201.1 lipoprotein NlpD [Pollutimonas bauzanensis]